MKFITTLSLLFFSLLSFGQNSKDKVIYLDSIGIETDSSNFYTKEVIEDYNLEKTSYTIKEYNKDNKLLVSKTVKDKKFFELDGEYTEYYTNGNLKAKLTYNDHKKTGDARAWYESGNLKLEGNYTVTKDSADFYIKNYWDENQVQKVINGEGIYVESEKTTKKDTLLFTVGQIVKGKKHGHWKNLNDGFPIVEDKYENGVLISGKITYSENESYTYKEIKINASPNEGMKEFRKKVSLSIRMPDVETSINIKTLTGFVIDSEGKLTDIKILSYTSPLINDEILRVLNKAPKWKPGYYRGKPVKSNFKLPIQAVIGEY